MPVNLVFRRKIWGARDNGIPPRSTPGNVSLAKTLLPGIFFVMEELPEIGQLVQVY